MESVAPINRFLKWPLNIFDKSLESLESVTPLSYDTDHPVEVPWLSLSCGKGIQKKHVAK